MSAAGEYSRFLEAQRAHYVTSLPATTVRSPYAER
jgi:hypothetical protein